MASVARSLAMALDPVLLARAAGIEPDPWQATLLRSTAPRILLNCARQVGKTSTVSILAGWTATYEPGSLTLAVCPTERQSAELLLKVRKVLSAVGWPVAPTAEGVTHLELVNGSRLLALPGSEGGIRGLSGVRLLLADEAARIPRDLLAAIRPMMATQSNAKMIALSTPNGRFNWFAEAWEGERAFGGSGVGLDEDDGPEWEKYLVTADLCKRIPAWFLKEERRALGERLYRQEYLCEFTEMEGGVFDMAEFDDAIREVDHPWELKSLGSWTR